tara:strand:+ start:656 stop:1042 length:387 start_codon:yes stop_codon:yes gene_type:complete
MPKVTVSQVEIDNTQGVNVGLTQDVGFRINMAAMQDANLKTTLKWFNESTLSGGSTHLNERNLYGWWSVNNSHNNTNSYVEVAWTSTTTSQNRGTDVYTLDSMEYVWKPLPQRGYSRMSVLAHGGRRA